MAIECGHLCSGSAETHRTRNHTHFHTKQIVQENKPLSSRQTLNRSHFKAAKITTIKLEIGSTERAVSGSASISQDDRKSSHSVNPAKENALFQKERSLRKVNKDQ